MEWSIIPPVEPDYYWAYENLDPEDADVMLVLFDGSCVWDFDGQEFELGDFSHWMGPIEIPTPPDESVVKLEKFPYQSLGVKILSEILKGEE